MTPRSTAPDASQWHRPGRLRAGLVVLAVASLVLLVVASNLSWGIDPTAPGDAASNKPLPALRSPGSWR